ncbi:YccF domain-containing protein [Roseivirga sp. UBA838]|uniref:YccF domain-containing protein n=1 Tax=Roseivirga sp. UBA838 TaxID=1947393 RepID=UPI00257AA7A2|nr:YccF domain-containing protein [Roseivirga sp. UBA838]|tara:strand:- start:47254 stop:47619 length:366 start_codon:yes stop_codon:yes gene_type:complete
MRLLANIIWIIFGGWMIALEYIIGGIALCMTIVGIPFGIQCFKLAILGFAPFGKEVKPGSATGGCLFLPLNIIWIIFGGFWIFLTHLFWGLVFCITIIGIPFGLQHFKLAGLAFAPFGRGG